MFNVILGGVLRAIVPAVTAVGVSKGILPAGSQGDLLTILVTAAATGWSIHKNAK
jgi:hypothetical protein